MVVEYSADDGNANDYLNSMYTELNKRGLYADIKISKNNGCVNISLNRIIRRKNPDSLEELTVELSKCIGKKPSKSLAEKIHRLSNR